MFGDRLKNILEGKDITQTMLAKDLGFSVQAINRWCNNICEPDIKTILKLSHYLEISTDYLLGNEKINNENNIKERIAFKNILTNYGYLKNGENLTNEELDRIIDFIKSNKKFIS